MPSFIIIFLSRDTALSGFSFRRIFTVNMVLFLVEMCVCMRSCLAAARFRSNSTRVLYHDLSSLSSGPSQVPGTSGEAPGCRVLQACRSASSWWRFGLCEVGYGCWGIEGRWIKMTCTTQQYAPIFPIHRHNVI